MSRLFLIFLFLTIQKALIAQKPVFTLTASGNVTSMVKDGSNLYVATDNGTTDIFDLKTKKRFVKIVIPDIKDFMGDMIAAKVYSVDKIQGSDSILIVCQGESGFRNVFIYKDKLVKVIDASVQKLMIKEARFLNSRLILLGLTSDELLLFDLIKRKIRYRIQINSYTFADMVLNIDRTRVLTSDESGIIQMFNPLKGTYIKKFEGENVDNVFSIDFKNNILICGGKDRRVAVYDDNSGTSYHFQGDFPVYCVGLSPDGSIGAYSSNEDNDVMVFDVYTKNILYELKGHESTLTTILFIADNELITSCESKSIYFWKLK